MSQLKEKNQLTQDFELNLAPIVDCFTVLITFMLVSASFISIGILDAGAGAGSTGALNQVPPEVILQVQMQTPFVFELKVSGKVTQTIHLSAQNGAWDYEGLVREISGIKQKWPKLDSLILNATDEIEYVHIVGCMEKLKKVIPGVLLAGF